MDCNSAKASQNRENSGFGRGQVMFRPVRLDAQAKASIVRRGALGMAGVVLQGTSRVITNLTIGRIGGPIVLGTVASAISTAQLLSLMWPTSTGSAASKFVARARGKQDFEETSAVASHLGTRTLQTTVVLACAAVPAWMALDGGDLFGGLWVAILVMGYSGYSFTRGLHFGSAQILRATKWDLVTSILGILGVLASLILGVRGLPLLMPLAAASLIYTFACWPWRARGTLDPAIRREIDIFVALASAGTLASSGFLQLSMIAARLEGGREGAGQYAAALALATPLSIVAGSLSLVLYPSMSEAFGRGDHESLRRQTDQATRFLAVVMVAVVGSLALCSRLIVSLIWGARYVDAGELLPILLVAILSTTLGVPSVNSLTSRRQDGMFITTSASILGLVIGATTWVLTTPQFGAVGIAIGYLAGTITIAGVAIASTWRREQQHWRGLILRLTTATGMLIGFLAAQQALTLSHWLDPAFAFAFSFLWLALSRTDAHHALTLLTQRLRRR
jgi:putative peptidoglycan lipid II flippase